MKTKLHIGFSTNRDKNFIKKFSKEIRESIGLKRDEYEILAYVNKGDKSLTEAYNLLWDIDNRDDVVCVFIHHDIHFKTKGWGKNILNIFNNNEIDILGVAGTDTLYYHGAWWLNAFGVFKQDDLWGKVWHTDGKKEWQSNFSGEKKCAKLQPVVAVDGLFISFDPETCEMFDESFTGFHFYDISFCVKNFQAGKKIFVTETIPICHESGGVIGPEWENNRQKFISKYSQEGKVISIKENN